MSYVVLSYSSSADQSAPAASGTSKISSSADLKSEIDAGRTSIKALEARLHSEVAEMNAMDLRLDSLDSELEFMKRRLDAGILTGANEYKAAIETYNDLVATKHRVFLAYNADFDRYDGMWRRERALVAEYNARSWRNRISSIPIEVAIRMAEIRAQATKPVYRK